MPKGSNKIKSEGLPKSYSEARKLGVPHYYTGVPCKKSGHLSVRDAKTATCYGCRLESGRERLTRRLKEGDLESRKARIIDGARNSARIRGLEFTITKETVEWNTHCPIFGTKLEYFTRDFNDNTISLDRIDNNKGYIPGNVETVSLRANFVKKNGTLSELTDIWFYMDDPGEESENVVDLPSRRKFIKEIRHRANQKGIPVDSRENLLEVPFPEICPVLGCLLKFNKGVWGDDSYSFDKFNPNLGYIKDNIRVISYRANSLKRNSKLEELTKVIQHMSKQATTGYYQR